MTVNSKLLPLVCQKTPKYLEVQFECMKTPKSKNIYKNRLPRLVGNLSDVWSDKHDMLDSNHVNEVISNYMHNTTDSLRNENGLQRRLYKKETFRRNAMKKMNISTWLEFEFEHHDRESNNTTQNDGPTDGINLISIKLVIILTSSLTLVIFSLLVASLLVYKVS